MFDFLVEKIILPIFCIFFFLAAVCAFILTYQVFSGNICAEKSAMYEIDTKYNWRSGSCYAKTTNGWLVMKDYEKILSNKLEVTIKEGM